MANDTFVHGWQDQPNSRGTFDIIRTCIITVLLLCWSSVCPNVPDLKTGFWTRSKEKFKLFVLAILGPDFVFVIALGQLNAAWRAKKALRNEGYTEWGLCQCFFVNMGGLHLEFRDRKIAGLPSFPVDCEQLQYLVQHNYLALPVLNKDDINDRNKSDGLTRTITIIQTLWFTAEVFGRITQGLFITTIEVTTLSFVFMMICCSICWWHKPMDISRPMIVYVDIDLSTVLHKADAPRILLGRTPLSFLNRKEWFLSQVWFYYTQILRNMKLFPPNTKPMEATHFASDEFPEIDLKWEIYFGWTILAYSAIFMAAWNFPFPTAVELRLWRISAIICLSYGILGTVLAAISHQKPLITHMYQTMLRYMGFKERESTQMVGKNEDDSIPNSSSWATALRSANQWFGRMRNISPDHDPMLSIPVRIWLPTTALCFMYTIARAYILIEDFLGLRSLPKSAFQTVDWAEYSPIL
jgi:hypothetical protein